MPTTERKTNITDDDKKCPLGECDGTGIAIVDFEVPTLKCCGKPVQNGECCGDPDVDFDIEEREQLCRHVLYVVSPKPTYIFEKRATELLFNLITVIKLFEKETYLLEAAIRKLNDKRTITYG